MHGFVHSSTVRVQSGTQQYCTKSDEGRRRERTERCREGDRATSGEGTGGYRQLTQRRSTRASAATVRSNEARSIALQLAFFKFVVPRGFSISLAFRKNKWGRNLKQIPVVRMYEWIRKVPMYVLAVPLFLSFFRFFFSCFLSISSFFLQQVRKSFFRKKVPF